MSVCSSTFCFCKVHRATLSFILQLCRADSVFLARVAYSFEFSCPSLILATNIIKFWPMLFSSHLEGMLRRDDSYPFPGIFLRKWGQMILTEIKTLRLNCIHQRYYRIYWSIVSFFFFLLRPPNRGSHYTLVIFCKRLKCIFADRLHYPKLLSGGC